MKHTSMIHRLIRIKQRAAEAAEKAHVAAHHATVAAEQKLQHAVVEHLGRKIIDDAERDVIIARSHEAMTRQVMTEARIELRRYETWLENTKELQRLEAERAQRTRKQA